MNNAREQLKAADALTQLWTGLFPDYELPSRAQFLTWSSMCPEEIAAHAFNRAARKALRQRLSGSPLSPERLGRYISGIIVNERNNRHCFSPLEGRAA